MIYNAACKKSQTLLFLLYAWTHFDAGLIGLSSVLCLSFVFVLFIMI